LGLLRRYIKSCKGVIAVEFSMVALPFILLMVGTLEMAIMFASQSLLDGATANASRLIRTGQLQGGGDPQADFELAVCTVAQALMNCNDLQYQVISVDNFEDADNLPDADFDADGNLTDTTFDPGNENDVVLVRVSYTYDIATPMFQPLLTNMGNDKRIIMSTVVLQNEPYQWNVN
jgi:Flp pilus assembly protein TadG